MSGTGPHDPYRALREPGFRRYLAGNLIGTIGFQMQGVAVGWELYERTHSAFALGVVGLVQVVPIILLFLPVGHLVDRYERRKVLMVALAGMALAAAGLAAVSVTGAPVPLFYAFLFLSGTARALLGPAKSALLPEIVGIEAFQSAVAWNSGGWQMAEVLGPAIGGALLAATRSPALVYLTHAALALAFAALVAGVRSGSARQRPVVTASLDSLLDGARYVLRTRILLAAITLDLFAVLFGGAVALLPVYAKDILHVGPAGLGGLLAAQAIGAVSTTLVLAHLPPFQRAGPALLRSVALFGIATIGFGVSRFYVLSLLALAMAGAADSVSVVIRMTLAQLGTPDALRGRVSAVNSLFIGTSNQLGEFESGAVAGLFGPVFSVVAGGIGTLVVVALVALRWPEVRRLGRLEEAQRIAATGHPSLTP
ncbi:MAG TPA: MFS transporter [Gemmatimonadales bacterium]|nr:MFS transporter [Gemmatimonadales bacterium]